ncbi:hypothetical protein [Streptomyces sp. NPDC059639]|uniref:hypothetical protein n=1 Tax=Streptomyces sp. NPDC059639 TaxID=3346891 RepID=UPI00368357B6
MQGSESEFGQLREALVWDIQFPGYIDRDGTLPRFNPFPESVYLALGDGYLRLNTVGDEGRMTMELVPEPIAPTALDDSDDEFAMGSCSLNWLADAHSEFRITRIRGVRNAVEGPLVQYDCMEFQLEKSWYLFIDPSYHFGIRVQGEGFYFMGLSRAGGGRGDVGAPDTLVGTPSPSFAQTRGPPPGGRGPLYVPHPGRRTRQPIRANCASIVASGIALFFGVSMLTP